MSSESPASELYSSNGVEIAIQNSTTLPTGVGGLISVGSDGTTARFMKVDASGNQIVVGLGTAGTPAGGVISVQGITGMTALTVNNATATNLLANIGGLGAAGSAPTGNPIYIGASVTTAAPTYSNATMNALSLTLSGGLRIDGVYAVTTASTTATNSMQIGGAVTTSAPTYSNATFNALSLDTSGNLRVTTVNASVGSVAATPPASATYIGASVTTNAPTYTTGQMDPLSLTTAGLLRIDGVYPINATTPTSDATFVAGAVTTAPPTYTTGQMSALSLDTGGNLRSITPDVTATGALGALNAAVQIILSGQHTVGFQLAAGTLIGTIVAEMSFDGGTTWNSTQFDQTSGNKVTSVVFATANTALASTMVGVGGAGLARVRVSAYTSGTANITLRASQIDDPSVLYAGTAGASLPPTISQAGGSVTTAAPAYTTGTLNALSLDTSGNLRVTSSAAGDTVGTTVALNAVNVAATVILSAQNSVGMVLAAGTLIGTIVPEISVDGGTTWVSTFFDDPTTGNKASSIVFASVNTVTTRTIVGAGGASNARVRVSVRTSGTANCTLRATNISDPSVLFSDAAGAPIPPLIAQMGGSVTTANPIYTTGTLNSLSLDTSGNLRVNDTTTSTVKPLYGTTNQSITISPANLATGVARASTVVDNTTNLYEDVLLFFKYTTGTTGLSATGYVNVYGYGSVDGGTTYPEGITGTDATVTLTTPPNLILIAQFNANSGSGTNHTYNVGPISFCRFYGLDKLPARWGIVIVNETGATSNATAGDFAATYQGINSILS